MTRPGGSAPILRIGIAGLGQAGAALVPAILRDPRCAITAVCDARREAVAAFARDYPAEAHADIKSLCASSAVDLIYIATPTHLHASHALLAAAHGKHVMVEKPMALTLGEADGMIGAAARRGVHLIVGHSQSFEPPVRAMRDLVDGGTLGALRMMHTWSYTDWLYRPRAPAELDGERGGGVLFRQGAHQVDLLRWVGGGLVRSVRAATGAWDAARPAPGSHTLFLDFAGGAVATAVYSGYDHLLSTELTFGVGEDGREAGPRPHGGARAAFADGGPGGEARRKQALGYDGARQSTDPPPHASFYGLTVLSCDRGDVRQTPEGLRVYGDTAQWDIPVPPLPTGRDVLLDEAYEAVVSDRPPPHGGAWGKANLEVCLAAVESTRTRREVTLHHQVATP